MDTQTDCRHGPARPAGLARRRMAGRRFGRGDARFMSDSRKTRRLVRSKRRSAAAAEGESPAAEAPEVGGAIAPLFAVVASGENVVMIHTMTGQTWAMASDGQGPVWHPAVSPPRRRARRSRHGAAGTAPIGHPLKARPARARTTTPPADGEGRSPLPSPACRPAPYPDGEGRPA
jgi:hypothetical protein